jgi:uncharacterized protein (DUF58 family)
VLGKFWLLFSGLLLVLSLFLHQVTLLLVALLIFLVGGISRLWQRYCLSQVEYKRKLSANRVFFGEEVLLELDISNKKPLPLPWVQIDDDVPSGVTFAKGKIYASHLTNRSTLSNLLSLSWYHRVKRYYPLQCLERGYFTFGPARMRSGDLFGFFNREETIPQVDTLIVYPRIVPLETLGIPSTQPIGDIRTRSHIFQDPILTMGIREYHTGDSLRNIHWKSTARLGKLQTKVYEPTTTMDMGIFLDVRTVEPPLWGVIPELLELAIVATASMSKYALDEGYRLGLYINQGSPHSEEYVRIAPSQHNDQLQLILEALAQVYSTESIPIAKLVSSESANLPWVSTMVVITAVPTEAMLSSILQVKRAGRKVVLITVGGKEGRVSTGSLSVYHIPDDALWRNIEALKIQTK